MPWVRGGDTSATFPPLMRVASLPGADERSVNEVMGFVYRLSLQSGAHLTDYIVDVGTVEMFAGQGRMTVLLRQCVKVGLLTKIRANGLVAYKILEDPDFLHLRLKAEVEWERQQQRDGKNRALAVPVRARDGDLCRYCGVMVMWRGRPGRNSATLDHLEPGAAATFDTLIVACRGCNSGLRDIAGVDRDEPKPEPTVPYYSEFTADWLTKNGHPTAPSERPDSQPDSAERATRKKRSRQRPGSQSETAPVNEQRPDEISSSDTALSASDPAAKAGHRAQEVDLKADSQLVTEAIGTSCAGSGRGGSGTDPPLTQPTPAGTRRRRNRSRRGKGSR